ncbi:MAG TPA: hypothetical protein VFW50_26010 [Streptosporangiaceae bacterium]|nr:hypothetical protein [Streptosporangiaceae bacterium]
MTGRLARTHPAGPAPTTTYSNIPPPRPPSSTGTGTAPRWNIFRDGKPGAALRHLPSGYPQVNLAWMWGALLAANMAAWLHQLTARIVGEDIQAGHGVRGGKAMIATLRRRLIAVPGRLTRHARHLVLRLPPGHYLLPEVLTRLRQLPAPA